MKPLLAVIALMASSYTASSQEGAIIRCGASKGTSYFFHDQITNKDGPKWSDDGMSKGKINLVRLGSEWDIMFDDAIDSYSYRRDGATVILLGQTPRFLTVGAFFQSKYADIYTFDLEGKEVAWTSSKIGTLLPKVGVYRASCE